MLIMLNNSLFKLILLNIFLVASVSSQGSIFFNPNGYRFSLGTDDKRTASVSYGDLDNDGDIDLIFANGRHWPDQNEIFLNSGDGNFNVSYDLGVFKSTSYAAELADFDQDGDCLLYTSPSPRDATLSRMPSSA